MSRLTSSAPTLAAGKDGGRVKNRTTLALCALVVLTLIVGGGNLWASWAQVHADRAAQHREQVAQQHAGAVLGEKLCTTFGKLAALKPPAGDPRTNPSRAYDQESHATLVQLGTDLGCR